MAIKSIKDLPKGKQATQRQADTARKAKAINVKFKNLGRKHGRLRLDLGTHSKSDVAGVVKGFRQKQKVKADFGTVLMDTSGNVIGRTHVARGHSTVPEQLAVKAISKYAKGDEPVRVIAIVPTKQFEEKAKKKPPVRKAAKKATKKAPTKKAKKAPTKKAAKKVTRKPAKKAVKKTKKKAAKKGKKK